MILGLGSVWSCRGGVDVGFVDVGGSAEDGAELAGGTEETVALVGVEVVGGRRRLGEEDRVGDVHGGLVSDATGGYIRRR